MSRNKILTPLVAASLAVSTYSTLATAKDGLTIIPQVAIQQKDLDFTQVFVGGGPNLDGLRGKLDTKLPTAAFSLTSVYDRFFVSLKYETNYADSFSFSAVAFSNAISNIDRSDFNLTVGANIWQGLNGFAGYITGETTIKPESNYIDLQSNGAFSNPTLECLDINITFCQPAVLPNPSKEHQLQGIEPYRQNYREEGWFMGLSYGYSVGDIGTLTGSMAYALMDGQYRDNYRTANPDFADLTKFLYKGDSKGTSFALTWTAPLNNSLNYYVDARMQKYKMDASDQTGNFGGPTARVKTNENMTTFTLGLQVYL